MTRWLRSPAVLWRRSGSSVVILPPQESEAILVTGTGVLLWEVLAEPIGGDQLAQLIASLCGSQPEQIARDTEPLLAELRRRGVIGAVP